MDFLDWFLVAWVVASVVATPLVARFVARRLGEPPTDERSAPELTDAAHD